MSLREDSIFVAAHTGCAAMNIDGKTLHSLLKLPRKFKEFSLIKNEIEEMFKDNIKMSNFLL